MISSSLWKRVAGVAVTVALSMGAPVAMAVDTDTQAPAGPAPQGVEVTNEQQLREEIGNATENGAVIKIDNNFAVSNRIDVAEKVTLTGAGTITFGESAGFRVQGMGNLTLDGPTLDGGGDKSTHEYPIIYSDSNLTITSGKVTGYNAATSGKEATSAVTVNGGTFTMNGGSITGNTMNNPLGMGGGGLGIFSFQSPITAVINDGEISHNASTGGIVGGGISAMAGRGGEISFTLNGGTVTDNTLTGSGDAVGGGIGIFGIGEKVKFTMNGGIVSDNTVTGTNAAGGGIGAGTNNPVTINAGIITGNESSGMGGGIYTDDGASSSRPGNPDAHNVFHNLLVTKNTATNLGGGIWLCPTGAGTTYVSEGGAIIGNSASNSSTNNTAGDDFVAHPRHENNKVTLSARMLGGVTNHWYVDGGNVESVDGKPIDTTDGKVSRYDSASDKNTEQIVKDDTNPLALKNVPDSAASASQPANVLAKTIISNNKAKLGGGIASNSTITIGNPNAKEISITVDKHWDESVTVSNRKPVKVQLKLVGTLTADTAYGHRGDEVNVTIDEVTLNAQNSWSHTFAGLALEDTLNGLKYQVAEVGDEYDSSVSDFQKNGNHWTVIITNKVKKPADTTVDIPGVKTLEGRDLKAGEFSFAIKALSPADAPLPRDTTVVNKADGSFSFGPITYTDADLNGNDTAEFTYQVSEVTGDDASVTYDSTVYTVKITVTKRQDGTFATTTRITLNGEDQQSIMFKNRVTPPGPPVTPPDKPETPSTDVTIPGVKTLEGRDLKAGEFSFAIKALSPADAPLPKDTTVVNKADGSFSFGPITYTDADLNGNDTAEFTYQVSETMGQDVTVTYDKTVYIIKVTVTRIANRLVATYKVYNESGNPVDAIAFSNTATPGKPDQPGKPDNPAQPSIPSENTPPDKLVNTGSGIMFVIAVAVILATTGIAIFVASRCRNGYDGRV